MSVVREELRVAQENNEDARATSKNSNSSDEDDEGLDQDDEGEDEEEEEEEEEEAEEEEEEEEWDEEYFDDECFNRQAEEEAKQKLERHKACLEKFNAVRDKWEALLKEGSTTDELKIKATIDNLEETRVVLEEYLLELEEMKVEKEEIHKARDEVIAMKLQLEYYLEAEEESQKIVAKLQEAEQERMNQALYMRRHFSMFNDHRSPFNDPVNDFNGDTEEVTTSTKTSIAGIQPSSDTFFAPRIVVMEIAGVNDGQELEQEATENWTLQLKDEKGNMWRCFLSNMRFTDDFRYCSGRPPTKILVLANAHGGRKYPLIIRRNMEKMLVEVPDYVPLGKVACPIGYNCESNDEIEITKKEWERYYFNTTTILKASDVELVLLDCPDETGLTPYSPITIYPAWRCCVVGVEW